MIFLWYEELYRSEMQNSAVEGRISGLDRPKAIGEPERSQSNASSPEQCLRKAEKAVDPLWIDRLLT